MNERENEYRGCRLHRYLVAEATPAAAPRAARSGPRVKACRAALIQDHRAAAL